MCFILKIKEDYIREESKVKRQEAFVLRKIETKQNKISKIIETSMKIRHP